MIGTLAITIQLLADSEMAWLIVPLVVVLIVISFWWSASRSHTIIDQWASENGYTVLSSSRSMFGGPFFFRQTESQTVYYVTVRDTSGRVRRAYVRCGSFFGGLWSDKMSVEWQD